MESQNPFETLQGELGKSCCVLHYTRGEDGNWSSIVEADHGEDWDDRDAAQDILAIIKALGSLSESAKKELASCYRREFNIGFRCWDTWGYVHQIPPAVVRAVADASCSIAVTLYPMRNVDGTPKE